jgi:hypothetical protein
VIMLPFLSNKRVTFVVEDEVSGLLFLNAYIMLCVV